MTRLHWTSPLQHDPHSTHHRNPRDFCRTDWICAPWTPPRYPRISRGAKMFSSMNYQDRIVRDPQIVGGAPVFKGTRVTLKTVLASLAEGATTAEILADFPTRSEEDVRAVIAFAAGSAQEDMPLIETPIKR